MKLPNGLSLSVGNMKIGRTVNLPISPIQGCCHNCIVCAKSCYAIKAYRLYKNVKAAWDKNLGMINEDPECLEEVYNYIVSRRKPVEFFRIHTSGDFINREYFLKWCDIAKRTPEVNYLAFTKNYDLINENVDMIPENMNVVFSGWTGLAMENPNNFPVAWLNDGIETRIPETATECSGSCETCKDCWSIKKGESKYFNKH